MGWKENVRTTLIKKYGGRCAYCGQNLTIADMQIDHIMPIATARSNEEENLNPACANCNVLKNSKTIEQFRCWLYERQFTNPALKTYFKYSNNKPEKIIFHFEKRRQNNAKT